MAIKLTSYYRGSHVPELPGVDTFHSTALFHIFEGTPGCNPLLLTISENGNVLAKILVVVQRIARFIPFYNIRRCVSYGTGEYFCPDDQRETLFNEMLKEITNYARRLNCFVIEVRNLPSPLSGFASFRRNSYFPVNWLRVRNTFTGDEKGIEQSLSQSRKRQIKNAIKNGAEIGTAQTEAEIKAFSLMLKRNYLSKIRKHFPAIEFFEQIQRGIKDVHIGDSWQRFKIFIVSCDLIDQFSIHDFHDPVCCRLYKLMIAAGEQDHAREFDQAVRRWFKFKWKWLNRLCLLLYS